jgi:hypothetical protein
MTLKVALAVVIIVAVIGHALYWMTAYRHVRNIEDRHQQARALISPWWMFDRELLPKEHDGLRKGALLCFAVYAVAAAVLCYLAGR